MNKQRYSKKFDFYYYDKEFQLFKRFKKRTANNTHIKEKYLSDMKTFIESIRILENYSDWMATNKTYKLIINDEELSFVLKNAKKYGDFQFHNKERQLFYYAKKRAEQGNLPLEEKYCSDMKAFIELIRTLENYDEWLNGCRDYELAFDYCNKRLFFNMSSCQTCAKINKYTKKATYFNSVNELSEDVGYAMCTVGIYMNTLEPMDGFYYCYADRVEEFLQQL